MSSATFAVITLLGLGSPPGGDPGEVAAYAARLRDARAALARSDFERARTACREAVEASGGGEHGNDRTAEAHEVCGQVELKAKRPEDALGAFQQGSHAAGEGKLRARLLARRGQAATAAKKTAEAQRVKALVEHDAALERLAGEKTLPASAVAPARLAIERALDAYRKDGDEARADRARVVALLVRLRGGDPTGVGELKQLGRDKGRAPGARTLALEALAAHGESSGDLELALVSALELSSLRSEGLAEDQRRYARAENLDRLCARYDEARGEGSCARLERRTTGRFSFTDFSRSRPKKALSEEDLSRVHAQLVPALEDCILTAARQAPDAFSNTDVEIAWVVQPEGAASDLEIAPRRVKRDVEGCLGERLSWARYPPYSTGERTTVRIPFHLSN